MIRRKPASWPAEPDREFGARSPGGPPIAIFPTGDGPPIALVHGATADHTTWRTSGPLLARRHTLYPIDRRGRGESGDGRLGEPYEIDREFDGDTFFPAWDRREFTETSRERHHANAPSDFDYAFVTYQRIR